MSEKKDLVTKEDNAFAIPEDNLMAGLENVDETVIALPRIKLLQATSPEVQGEEYADLNLRAGNLIEIISKEKVSGEFIPIMVLPSTNILFVPRNAEGTAALRARKPDITDDDLAQQGAMICAARDGKVGDRYGACSKCGLCMFQGNEKPICQRSINVLVLLDTGLPAVVSFRDTSYKHGTKFVSLLRNKAMTGVHMQSCKYKLSPTKQTRGDQQWYELKVIPNGVATEEETYQAYKMYETYKNTTTVEPVVDEPISDGTEEFI